MEIPPITVFGITFATEILCEDVTAAKYVWTNSHERAHPAASLYTDAHAMPARHAASVTRSLKLQIEL